MLIVLISVLEKETVFIKIEKGNDDITTLTELEFSHEYSY